MMNVAPSKCQVCAARMSCGMMAYAYELRASNDRDRTMTTLTVDLPNSIYERLSAVARRRQTTIEAVVQEWLAEKSAAEQPWSERERATAALRAAGLLTELSAAEKERAARSTLTLEEARAILDRAGGKPLSEIILEMRGPKE